MPKKDAVLTVRIDSETKKDAEKVLKTIGLDYSKAVNIFLRQVIIHNGIPFDISLKKDEE
jgi:DNA-damage-inducible protein J